MVTPSPLSMKIDGHLEPNEDSGSVEGSLQKYERHDRHHPQSSSNTSVRHLEDKIDRTDNIRKSLEKTISNEAKNRINGILTNIGQLSDVEKLLLYLKLPTGAAPCQPPPDALAGRSDLAQLSTWLKTHLEEDANICLPKQEAYDEYSEHCEKHGYKAVGQADFGRMVRAIFPTVKPRRLGPRGQSKHCYGGMKKKVEFLPPKLPEIRKPPVELEIEEEASPDTDSDWVASSSLVCEWAHKLLNSDFQDVKELAEYLVSHSYVDGRSEAAFTVIAASQKAGRALNIVIPDEPSSNVAPPRPSSKVTSNPGTAARPQPSVPKGPAKLQLQKKLQERELIKEQKRKLEAQRCEITGVKPPPKAEADCTVEMVSEECKKPDFDHTQGGKKVDVHKDKDKFRQRAPLTPQKLILPKTLATSRVQVSAPNTYPSIQSASIQSQAAKSSTAQPLFMLSPSPARGSGKLIPSQMVILSPVNRMVVPSSSTQLVQVQQPFQQQLQYQQVPNQPIMNQQPLPPKTVAQGHGQTSSNDLGALNSGGQKTSNANIPITQMVVSQTAQLSQNQTLLPYGSVVVQSMSQMNSVTVASSTSTMPYTTSVTSQGGQILSINRSLGQSAGQSTTAAGAIPTSQSSDQTNPELDTVKSEPERNGFVPVSTSTTKGSSLLQQVLQKQDTVTISNSVTTTSQPGAFQFGNQGVLDLSTTTVASPSSSTSSGDCVSGGGLLANSRQRTTSMSTQRSTSSMNSEDSCDSQTPTSPPPLLAITPGDIFMSPSTAANSTATTTSKSSRGKCSASKSRLSGKTVSTLLKEQRGVSQPVVEKKGFENDRRPVAQLLKESREKRQQGGSVHSPVVHVMSPASVQSLTPPTPGTTMVVGGKPATGKEHPLLLHTITLRSPLMSNVLQQAMENKTKMDPMEHGSEKQSNTASLILAPPVVLNNSKTEGILPKVTNDVQITMPDGRMTQAHLPHYAAVATTGTVCSGSVTNPAPVPYPAPIPVGKPAMDINSGVLAKLLRGEIDSSKVEKSAGETANNYSALKQALAYSGVRDTGVGKLLGHGAMSEARLPESDMRSMILDQAFVEVCNIPVSTPQKAPTQMSNSKSLMFSNNNNKLSTYEALVGARKGTEKDVNISHLEKDALQEYLGNDPVPDLADITPSIAQMVNSQDEETLTDTKGTVRDEGYFSQISQSAQWAPGEQGTSQPVTGQALLLSPPSVHREPDMTVPQPPRNTLRDLTATDKLLRVAQMVIDIQGKQRQSQDALNPNLHMFMMNQGKHAMDLLGQNFQGQYTPEASATQFSSGAFSKPRAEQIPDSGGYDMYGAVGDEDTESYSDYQTSLQPSPAPSLHSHHSASSTPMSVLSPQHRQTYTTGPVEPSNSFMPIQESSVDGIQDLNSPAQQSYLGSLPTSVNQQQPISQHTGKQAQGFLPYMPYMMANKQPPDYETSLQNQRLSHQLLQAQPQVNYRPQEVKISQKYIQPERQQLMPTTVQSAIHANLPNLPQFAPVSSIKPVKRGRATGNGNSKGTKRVRHSSAQDSFMCGKAASKESELASLLKNPLKSVSFGGNKSGSNESAAYLPVTVSVGQNIGASYLSNPPESPFSPEIQDIMGGGSDQLTIDQSFSSLYRSHSVPAHMLGGCNSEIQDIFRTNTALDMRNDSGEFLDSLPNSEIASLLQDKLQQEDSYGCQRGVHLTGRTDFGAKKNLTELLETHHGIDSPHSFITRGDHLISGATVRPPLQYAIQQQLAAAIHSRQHLSQISGYHSNPVPTPPSSQNPTPDFSNELSRMAEDGQGFGIGAQPGNSAMDTPNSLEPVPSQDGQAELNDPLFSSVCEAAPDISRELVASRQIDIGWD